MGDLFQDLSTQVRTMTTCVNNVNDAKDVTDTKDVNDATLTNDKNGGDIEGSQTKNKK